MTAGASSPVDRFPRTIARVGGGLLLAFGLWAMAGPRSFFDSLATFDPYNQHLIQDLGAFQIGLGVVLLVAALVSPSDGLLTGLVGVGAAMAAHVVSHAVGHDLGGNPKVDIPVFALLGGLLLGGGLVRWRQLPA
ncbi:MAG: hypothetical protein P8P85_15470 [Acidimicrobiales bacterium]|jgi:hypothetical protein|nr:hypothetical protein [Acidimicrobiales bacterium]